MNTLKVSHLFKSYGSRVVLNDVNFELKPRSVTAVLGPNGAGKTTLFDLICGCKGPSFGKIELLGRDLDKSPESYKKCIGYLPELPPLYPEFRVEEAIIFAARIHEIPKGKLKLAVDKALRNLNLESVRKREIAKLSKGFKQRVAFAQAIVHGPELIVLDEPTEGLDPIQIVEVRNLIRDLAQEHTVLFSSHILSEVEQVCHELLILNKGRVLFQGGLADLKNSLRSRISYRLRVFYGAENLLMDLSTWAGMQTCSIKESSGEDGELRFDLKLSHQEDLSVFLRDLVLFLMGRGYILKELSPLYGSLEQFFTQEYT
ncbi:MAG: ABC transporter ATP-binding protein [Oligoflexales bacterium]|nr:ABC transporter ATP-binding protein [Oligoflexales bacterium]